MSRGVLWAIGIVFGVLMLLFSLRMFVTPINPKQEPPDFHVKGGCGVCHIVSERAKIVELDSK